MMTKMMKMKTKMTTKKTTTNGQRCDCDAALPLKFESLSLLWTPSSPLHIQVSELAVHLFLFLSNSSLWACCGLLPLPLKFESLSLLWTASSPSQNRVSELAVAPFLSFLNLSLWAGCGRFPLPLKFEITAGSNKVMGVLLINNHLCR
jgi:hypothetical protein